MVLSYIVGVALGDGNLSKVNKRSVRLRVSCDLVYPLLIAKITSAIQKFFPSSKIGHVRKRGRCLDISIYSNALEELLGWRADGGSKYIQRVRVPKWVFTKRAYRIACLSGLIETDGSVYTDRGYLAVLFTTVIPELAIDVMQLFSSLGFPPKLYRIQSKEVGVAKRLLPRYNLRLTKRVGEFLSVVPVMKK